MSPAAPEAGALAQRPQRLADLPAKVAYELAKLAPSDPAGLAAVRVRPAGTEARVVVEAVSAVVVASIEADGTAVRPISLPRAALLSLRRRHPEAERLTVDDLAPLLRLRTLGTAMAVAIVCPQGPALPTISLPAPAEHPGTGRPLLLDPGLLGRSLDGR